MSSPSSGGGNNNNSVSIREGTRVVLREITANLQNSPPGQSARRKSGNEGSSIKGDHQQQQQQSPQNQQNNPHHDVKVRFIREFADVGISPEGETNPDISSLSSASSFQSIASTLSSKCSSGICVDSRPALVCDSSYLSPDISGLDDLISGCENIRLTDKTLDLSKDQSFGFHLDNDDLSDDQTFTSAIDRNSLDRTRELSPKNLSINLDRDIVQNVDETHGLNEHPVISDTNDFPVSPENSGINEITDDRRNNLHQESVNENFVQCVSNLEQIDSTKIDGTTTKNHDDLDVNGVKDSSKNLENSVRNEEESNVNEVDAIDDKSTSLLLKQDKSIVSAVVGENVDGPLNQSGKVKVEAAVHEESTQSVLDTTVDVPNVLKNADVDPASKVDEESTQSVLDTTVDVPNVLNKPDVEELASKVDEESTQSVLDVTVDVPNVPKETDVDPASKVDEESTQSVLDTTVDVPNVLKNADVELASEVDEESTQSVLNVTVDVSNVSKKPDIPDIASISHEKDFDDPELSVNLDDTRKIDEIDCHVPAIPTLSELNEPHRHPSLPKLSSICLRDTFNGTDIPNNDNSQTNDNITDSVIPTETLSEKFANLAANVVDPGNSISTIKEPTFLNTQKLNDSTESTGSASPQKTHVNPENSEYPVESTQIEFDNFKKPEPPIARSNHEAVSSNSNGTLNVAHKSPSNKDNSIDEDSDNLDDTVTIQEETSGDNIFAIPESDQYAQFRPQQQSTALAIVKSPCAGRSSNESVGAKLIINDNSTSKAVSTIDEYAAFLPQQQSTALAEFQPRAFSQLERQPTPFVVVDSTNADGKLNGGRVTASPGSNFTIDVDENFEKLEIAAQAVANDIYNTSREIEEETSPPFVSATSELFHDPESFDFLLSKTPRKNGHRDLRAESLYVKFDPLVSNTSMLPQGNIQNASPTVNDKTNGDGNTTITHIGTPKRNPAIVAIDRLLFYSPMTTTTTPTNTNTNTNAETIQKTNVSSEKPEPTEETSPETLNMAKELELVRSTVIQLEEQVEKLKIDNEEALEKQSSYQDKINQLQTQLAQEIKNKNQITVVVDEYEKSISRLVGERERDRKNLDLEKAKLQEELAAAKHHLDNTEAAFNDVHLKYERLKAVVATYKNNEAALKQSVQENVEIIKSLENRYEQVKEHATARLEKANQDLEAIRKQNESETVRLHAMLRKAELKSNSLAELVEQKTKENKELTQILDEVIARVGRNKSE